MMFDDDVSPIMYFTRPIALINKLIVRILQEKTLKDVRWGMASTPIHIYCLTDSASQTVGVQ